MLLNDGRQLGILIHSARIYEARAQQSIIPIKDDSCFVELRFLLRGEPDLLVGELT